MFNICSWTIVFALPNYELWHARIPVQLVQKILDASWFLPTFSAACTHSSLFQFSQFLGVSIGWQLCMECRRCWNGWWTSLNESWRWKAKLAFAHDKRSFPWYSQPFLRKLLGSLSIFKPWECVTTGSRTPSLSERTFAKSFLGEIQTSRLWLWRYQGICQQTLLITELFSKHRWTWFWSFWSGTYYSKKEAWVFAQHVLKVETTLPSDWNITMHKTKPFRRTWECVVEEHGVNASVLSILLVSQIKRCGGG